MSHGVQSGARSQRRKFTMDTPLNKKKKSEAASRSCRAVAFLFFFCFSCFWEFRHRMAAEDQIYKYPQSVRRTESVCHSRIEQLIFLT